MQNHKLGGIHGFAYPKVIARSHCIVVEKYDWSLIARMMKEKVFDKLFENVE